MVITCVVAALLAMQVYFKRGIQGRLRQTADALGQQYAPKKTTGSSNLNYESHIRTIVTTLSNNSTGKETYLTETKSELVNDETGRNVQTQNISEHVGALEPSLYGD